MGQPYYFEVGEKLTVIESWVHPNSGISPFLRLQDCRHLFEFLLPRRLAFSLILFYSLVVLVSILPILILSNPINFTFLLDFYPQYFKIIWMRRLDKLCSSGNHSQSSQPHIRIKIQFQIRFRVWFLQTVNIGSSSVSSSWLTENSSIAHIASWGDISINNTIIIIIDSIDWLTGRGSIRLQDVRVSWRAKSSYWLLYLSIWRSWRSRRNISGSGSGLVRNVSGGIWRGVGGWLCLLNVSARTHILDVLNIPSWAINDINWLSWRRRSPDITDWLGGGSRLHIGGGGCRLDIRVTSRGSGGYRLDISYWLLSGISHSTCRCWLNIFGRFIYVVNWLSSNRRLLNVCDRLHVCHRLNLLDWLNCLSWLGIRGSWSVHRLLNVCYRLLQN